MRFLRKRIGLLGRARYAKRLTVVRTGRNMFVFGVVAGTLTIAGWLMVAKNAPQVYAEAGESITTGLVDWFKFNSSSGTTATDSSSSGNNGTLVNMENGDWSTDRPTPDVGNTHSLSFDGVNEYVSVSSPDLPTGDFTMTAWVKPTGWPIGKMSILGAGNGGTLSNTQELDWYFTSLGNMALTLDGIPIATTAFAFPLNQWSHVSVVRSGSTVTFYINGAAAGGGSSSATLNFGSCPMTVGASSTIAVDCNGGFTANWNGNLDDVRVYNQALNTTQLNQIAGAPLSGTLYADEFLTPIAAGKTVRLLVNGVDSGITADTNASGEFSIIGATYASGDTLSFFIEGETEKGLLLTRASAGGSMSGLNFSAGRIVLGDYGGGDLTLAQIDLGLPGGFADLTTLWDGSNVSATTFGIQAGSVASELSLLGGYSLDLSGVSGSISLGTGLDIAGSFNVGSHDLNVAGGFEVDGGGAYLASGNTFTLSGNANASFGFSGAFPSNLNVNLGSSFSAALSGALNLGSNSLNISGGALNLAGQNLTMSGGAFNVVNGAKLRLVGNEVINFSGGTVQDVNSGTWEFLGTGSGTLTLPDWGATDYFNVNIAAAGTTFQFGGGLSVAGDLGVSAGTLTTLGNTLAIADDFNLTGGTFNLSSGGSLNLIGDLIGATGTLNLNGASAQIGGLLDLDTGASVTLGAGINFDVNGGLDLSGSASLNLNGQLAQITGNAALDTGASLLTGASGNLDLNGSLTLNGNATLTAGANALVDVSAGLNLNGTAVLALGSGADLTVGGNLAVAAGAGLSLTAAGDIDINGAMTLAGGTLALNAATFNVATTLDLSGGAAVTLGAGINFDVAGDLSIGSASLNLNGQLADINGALNLSGTGSLATGASGTLDVAGAIALSGSAGLNLGAGGALTGGGNLGLTGTAGIALGAGASLNLAGTGNLNLVTGTSVVASGSATIGLAGGLTAAGGTFTLPSGGLTVGSNLALSASAAVSLGVGSNLTIGGGATLAGGATLGFSGSTLAVNGTSGISMNGQYLNAKRGLGLERSEWQPYRCWWRS